ncbi:MAG: TIGR02588 family protein [Cyanobacteria bacterium J06614_10]
MTIGEREPTPTESAVELPSAGNEPFQDEAFQKARSLAEWITLTISTLVLLAIVGLVLYDWQLTKNLPPAFQIQLTEAPRLTENRYYVPFTLKNTGGQIARTVQVIAELHLPDGQDETGEQQFDFLSGNERKKGSFVFEHNPQTGDLTVRVASFGLP